MIVPILNDTHFGARNDNTVFYDYQQDFYERVFFPFCDKHNVTHMVHLGDIYDRRKYINFRTLDFSKRVMFDPLRERNIQCDVVLGNHDLYYKNEHSINSPRLLVEGDYQNVRVYDKLTVSPIQSNWVYLPWLCTEEDHRVMEEFASTVNPDDKMVLFAHLELLGFDMGGTLCSDGIHETVFRNFDKVITGHFHKKQVCRNIYYPGSQFQFTWIDHGQPKGFAYLDTETNELKYVHNRKQIFHVIEYDDTSEECMKRLLSEDYLEQYSNSFLKIIVQSRTNETLFETFMNLLYKWNPVDIKIVTTEELEFRLDENETVSKDERTVMSMTEDYVNAIGVPDSVKSDIISRLSKLYVEAMDVSAKD